MNLGTEGVVYLVHHSTPPLDTIMNLGTEGLTRVPKNPEKFMEYCKDILDESTHPGFHQAHATTKA
jgi:hypothetical protein